MDPALGPPDAMADKREELTPMMAQYFDLCSRYDSAIVLFQVGDFYETFCDAAERCARDLELTLTSREDSTGEYPMAGIPVDSASTYIEGLLEAGYRVAIADQVEEPGESDGVVERAVTRVITPGTLTEDELLSSDDNNFVAAVSRDGDELGVAFLDVSTGDFLVTSSHSSDAIADEVTRFGPSEAVVGPGASQDIVPETCMVTPYDERAFDHATARERVREYFGDPETILASDVEVCACGALLSYAEYARGGENGEESESEGENTNATSEKSDSRARLEYLTHLTRYDPREYLLLDAVALRSLELFEPRTVGGREEATLVGVLDETASALGGRKLKDWVRRPLLEPDRIESRLDAVEEFTDRVRTREAIQESLKGIYDLERLIGRISRERANARDLRSLRATLAVVPEIRDGLADVRSARLQELHDALDPLEDVRDLIERGIVEEPPLEITEGGIVAEGYDDDLDSLRETAQSGKQWIDDLEARERERTGIDSVKVGYTSVHGYYIEVTNPNLEDVPEEYERRQTLKRSERFVTPELREREDEIVGAEQRADEREYELFSEIRSQVAAEVERVQALAEALATIDALISLSTVAAQFDYCRPEILERGGSATSGADKGNGVAIDIDGGRHPVVERTQDSFVPNGARFDDDDRLAVITGPNMSGKSTYMRQIALIVLMAQVGSFVPAQRARIEPIDRIFTRVGASDDIAGGRSTFMVEMDELSTILREADEQSLVLLDEVGRGTSTADGLAIAQAIVEHLHDEVGAITLFATHHHPLTAITDDLGRAFTQHFEAAQEDGDVVFHHEIHPGAATGSYGIDVATAAGVPETVVERSRELVGSAAGGDGNVNHLTTVASSRPGHPSELSSDGGDDPSDIVAELRALEIAHLTPVEALAELDRLKRLLEE